MSRVYHTIRPMAARISSCPDVRVSGFRWWSDLWTHHPTEPLMCNFIEAVYLFASTRCKDDWTAFKQWSHLHHHLWIFSRRTPEGLLASADCFSPGPSCVCVYLYMCAYDRDPLGFTLTQAPCVLMIFWPSLNILCMQCSVVFCILHWWKLINRFVLK